MKKILCKLTGGHKYDEEHVYFFENFKTDSIDIEVRCIKCGHLGFESSYSKDEFINGMVSISELLKKEAT